MASKPNKPKLPPVPSEAELQARALEIKPAVERDDLGRLKPGQSLNPGGKPKVVAEVMEKHRGRLDEVMEGLYQLTKSPNSKTRLAAMHEWLDRVVGRARQTVDITTPEDPLRRLIEAVNGLGKPQEDPNDA